MMKVKDILNHLREQEFNEDDLEVLLNQLVREHMIFAANRAVAQYQECLRRFRERREQRLRIEFRNEFLPQLNEDRLRIKHERAQETYKMNRQKKKKYGKGNNIQLQNGQGGGKQV